MSVAEFSEPDHVAPATEEAKIMNFAYPSRKVEDVNQPEEVRAWHEVGVGAVALFMTHSANSPSAIMETIEYCNGMPSLGIPAEALTPDTMSSRPLGPDDRGFNNLVLGDPVRLHFLKRS